MSRKTIVLLLSLFACILFGSNAQAVLIDFTSQDSVPSNPLVFDGVTVTGNRPATLLGVGLGNDNIGSPGYVDRISHYGAGNNGWTPQGGYTSQMEGLSLQVDGSLNSFTIKPYFSGNLQLPIEIMYTGPSFGNNGLYIRSDLDVTVYNGDTKTFSLMGDRPVDNTYIRLYSDWGEFGSFSGYLLSHGYPETTFQYGFTIASLDYTPNHVPETGTLFLLCSGLIGVASFRKRFIH